MISQCHATSRKSRHRSLYVAIPNVASDTSRATRRLSRLTEHIQRNTCVANNVVVAVACHVSRVARNWTQLKAAFTRDATGSATAARQPRRKNGNIQQERLHGDTLHCCEPRRQFKFELIIAARHMLSRAVVSVFCEEHRPQKLPIHGLYAGVARDSCQPCRRYCRTASRIAACRAPQSRCLSPPV